MKTFSINFDDHSAPVMRVHTLIVGSGAAGLNAAVQLKRRGIDDILILTEGLKMGTSINTGSDKQTYYKMSLSGADGDSPLLMAQSYFKSGSMHGDLALVESALSTRAFFNLVDLGVKFPQDRWGQFTGYKTDHDPFKRATSVGPYTSRDMCRALIAEIQRLQIPVEEKRFVYRLLTIGSNEEKRVCGVLAVDGNGSQYVYAAENVVFAVGGPGGLYKTSVYPVVHTGAIGVALEAGAMAQGLPESQFGLASIKFRWNVSGSYMQVVPAFVSTAEDGVSDRREFLADMIDDPADLCAMIFLKGYQWPFDVRKVAGGSSVIDLLVYIETVVKGRRVFLDFRSNPAGYDFYDLNAVVSEYLNNCGAIQDTPFERLMQMNPRAVDLYREHGIDLEQDTLEIAVCAQHNNGGLAANCWWESVNLSHLFPLGEVNGSHGVARPGGSALNSGQVGGIRAADYIAACYADYSVDEVSFNSTAQECLTETAAFLERCSRASRGWREFLEEIRERMTENGAHIRSEDNLVRAVGEARSLFELLRSQGAYFENQAEIPRVLSVRQLCLAHLVYLESILYYVRSGAGSRGSAMVVEGSVGVDRIDDWEMIEENALFREKVLETRYTENGILNQWIDCRLIPDEDSWFESVWAEYREGRIYD